MWNVAVPSRMVSIDGSLFALYEFLVGHGKPDRTDELQRMTPYLAVLDFEATCAEDTDPSWSKDLQEIIEFPVALVSVDQKVCLETFHSMVRPTAQPELTPFCSELTSIQQEELQDQPTISEVMEAFLEWQQRYQLKPENCTVITCGDWDLRRMWPQQVSLVEDLTTPPIFRQWCNLKFAFRDHTGNKPKGMMDMLGFAGIKHQGRHHRGYDDVQNLVALVLWMVENGASFEPTWTSEQRAKELKTYRKKAARLEKSARERRQELDSLPNQLADEIGEKLTLKLESVVEELERVQRKVRVFED